MKRLKIILQSNSFYIISILIILIIIFVFTIKIKYKSIYKNGSVSLTCVVNNIKNNNETMHLDLNCGELLKGTYYLNDSDINLSYGDEITFFGNISDPSNNTIKNTFNYKKYLYNNKIYKIVEIEKIIKVESSTNVFVKIKNYIYKRCNNKYLSLFITGNKSFIESEVYNNYQNIGVAHLLAISGMHIAVLIKILKKIFKYIPVKICNYLIILILLYYAYIVNYSISVIRVILLYIINLINKEYDLNISNIKLLLLTSFLILIYNPFYIYNLSFQYSFLASLGVILSLKYNSNNYIKNIIIISFFTLLLTLPITININYEINLILFVSNLILIPFVTYIIFPFSLLTLLFPILLNIYNYVTLLMEYIVTLLSRFSIFVITIPKLSLIFIITYYLIIYLFFKMDYKRILLLLIGLFVINNICNVLNNSLDITILDVKQGDSISFKYSYNKAILIDTGSSIYKYNIKNIIKFFKSIGITKVEYLILTHGDYDHIGEAINLVNNFKVENVIFNCGEYNDLEKELISILEKKNINYYSCIKEVNIDKYKLQFLNTGVYDNENDNSSVIYLNYNNYKFLFMGDASITREKDILEKYNLTDIDFLKVGHHGSSTSSSEEFINSINLKYSLISVGKNNRYGHPKDEVLETLRNSKVYRTDLDGSIEIKLNKNGYKIRTCPP